MLGRIDDQAAILGGPSHHGAATNPAEELSMPLSLEPHDSPASASRRQKLSAPLQRCASLPKACGKNARQAMPL
ncbi:hypothetical protein ACKKBF_B40570 [Auxenochlorella protothecoides x Auxenochlorella symbiontica]